MEAADGADLFGWHSSMVGLEDGKDGEEGSDEEEDRRPTGSTEVRYCFTECLAILRHGGTLVLVFLESGIFLLNMLCSSVPIRD